MLSFVSSTLSLLLVVNAVWAAPTNISARGKECPYGHDERITLQVVDANTKDVSSLTMWYSGKGASGCAYLGILTIPANKRTGMSEMKVTAVAKTPTWGPRDISSREIEALTGVQELYTHGTGSDGLDWIVMKKQSGKQIFNTPGWRKQFLLNYNTNLTPMGISNCQTFMNALYKLILDKMDEYALQYGWEHGDLHWNNFLFSDDLTQVNIVDWGLGQATSSDKLKVSAKREQHLDALLTIGELPLEDTTLRMENVQGVCRSKMRQMGLAWVDPMQSTTFDH